MHNGVDLVAPQTAVVAASAGTVTAAGWGTAFGNRVIIDHSGGISTLYGHLAQIEPSIRVGDGPDRAAAGCRGRHRLPTGIHLHFTITVNGTDIDPVPFMLDHGAPLNGQPVGPTTTTTVGEEGGIGFDLPLPTTRWASLTNPPTPIPPACSLPGRRHQVSAAVDAAGRDRDGGDQPRPHRGDQRAGAQGLMQFMPATFASYAVDGNADGHADHRPR